ncbi:MAG: HD domain-containing phosphohydrolase [Gaiellaceae bacterium]|jgi:diguanylate cyclase (GGDEF)-like protein
MRIVKVMVLVVAIALVPLSIGLVMLKQQQNSQQALDRSLTNQVNERRANLQSSEDQARVTAEVLSQNPILNLPFTDLKHQSADRAKVDQALFFLGNKIYPNQIGAAGVINDYARCQVWAYGRQQRSEPCKQDIAHVANGVAYTTAQLATLREEAQQWVKATLKLKPGQVYTGKTTVSTDSGRFVVTYSTLLPPVAGESRGILYFELDLGAFRKGATEAVTRAHMKGLDLAVIDRQTGQIMLSSSTSAVALGLISAWNKRFVPIAKQKSMSGVTTISTPRGSMRVAWQKIPPATLDANRWTVVAAAPAPSGNVIMNNPIPVSLMGAALLAIAFIMGRRWVRTSIQAMTDPLTGLGNRRKLVTDLEKALPDAGETAPLLLGLFDLDGFKNYNDSFGHPAGDALLARLGRNVQLAMREHGGEAYRMGGDEFCIIATIGVDGQGPIIADATAALSERGEGFAIGSSYGSVLLPQEASDVGISLRLADQRLYANKNSGRRSAGRQSADVLLQALHERSPELGDHLVDVARLAAEVGRRLGMSGEELDQLAQAAQLHDVGKMAIPDAILKKPGPLDREEWEFIRGHTVVGERIISAAPSLSQVSRIVRSSHERYNGSGYPDGLKGDEIPLPSRIIAVCDAYDAMIGPRPYRLGMNRENAGSELRRCAGAQFDPVVIEFFLSVVDELVREETEGVPVNPS